MEGRGCCSWLYLGLSLLGLSLSRDGVHQLFELEACVVGRLSIRWGLLLDAAELGLGLRAWLWVGWLVG